MPRKKAVLVELPPEDGPEVLPEKSAEEEEADSIIEDVRAEQPKQPFDVVYAVDDVTGELAWVGRFATAAVTPEFLAKNVGEGTFKAFTRKPNERGKFVFAGSRVIKVDRRSVALAKPEASAPTAPATGDMSRDFLMAMMKSQQDASQNMMQMMMGMMGAITTAFTALKPTGPAGPDPIVLELIRQGMTRKDPMEIATSLLAVIKDNGGSKDPIDQLIRLGQARETLQGMFGNEGGTDEMGVIAKGLDIAASALAGARAPAATALVPARALPAPNAAAVPKAEPESPAVAPVVEEDVSELRMWMQPVVKNLPQLTMAAQFMPPEAAALTMRQQMQAMPGVWEDFVADVKTGYADDAAIDADEGFPEAFVTRTSVALALEKRLGNPQLVAWAEDVLDHAAWLALGIEDEDEGGEDASH